MVIAMGAAIAQTSQSAAATGALPCPVSASVAHLKVKGTAIVASLAKRSSSIAAATRSFRSARSAGQMNGHRWIRVVSRLARSGEITAFWAMGGGVTGLVMKLRAGADGRYYARSHI